jgi:hypothetical protein
MEHETRFELLEGFALVAEREGGESVPDFVAIETAEDAGDTGTEPANGFDLPATNPFD